MSEIDRKASEFQKEFAKATYEPFLPLERKLVGWSLGIGIFLLVILSYLKN